MMGLLLKIPYVKQIAIGLLLSMCVYMWYLMSQNETLLAKNGQLQMAVNGWEKSYQSLEGELLQYNDLLTERRDFEAELEGRQKTLKATINNFKRGNSDVKAWFDTRYPDSILELRKRLRAGGSTPPAASP